jgi:hypothetical protein
MSKIIEKTETMIFFIIQGYADVRVYSARIFRQKLIRIRLEIRICGGFMAPYSHPLINAKLGKIVSLAACLMLFLTLGLQIILVQAQTDYASITVNPTQGPWGSTVKVTIMISNQNFNDSGPDGAGSGVSVRIQDAAGTNPEEYMQRAHLDASGDYVRTRPYTWSCDLTIPVDSIEGHSVIRLYDWDTQHYNEIPIAETSFTVLPRNSGTTSTGLSSTDIALIALGSGIVAGGSVVGVRIFTRRRGTKPTKSEKITGEETGVLYEKPPETFVQQWIPPVDPPEKSVREEILIKWAITPDYVKQTWQNLEVCTQNAKDWQAQIEALKPKYEQIRQRHISNILKASIKLGIQTTEIITNGIQSAYIEKLRAAQLASQLTNDFARARMIGESLSEVEKYTVLITKAQQARQVAAQSAAQLKELIGQWDRKIAGHTAGFFSGDAMAFEEDVLKNIDPATKNYLSGNSSPGTIFNRYLGGSEIGTRPGGGYDEAVRISLKEALKRALSDMNGASAEIDAAQTGLKSALATANMMLETVGKRLSSGLSWVANLADKTLGQAPSLGGLDIDDPGILAEGQANLQRLQSRINWLQRNYQIAVNCVEENRGIIKGYTELQQQEEEKTKQSIDERDKGNKELTE